MVIEPKFSYEIPVDPKIYSYFDKKIDPEKAHLIAIDLVKREDWGALEPSVPPVPMEFARVVIWYHDIGFNPCHNAEECVQRVKDIQKYHMDLGLPDIAYNFLIGGDGRVYEGRGYSNHPSKIGDKWAQYEGKSMDFAYIGRFCEDKPAYPDMSEAGYRLLLQALYTQHLDHFFKFVEDLKPSECSADPCPYAPPDPEPGDPIVDFDAIGF